MKKKQDNQSRLGRRRFLPILGTGLLFSLLPVRGSVGEKAQSEEPDGERDFHTLLKPDGTVVKVPRTTVANAKVVKKGLSNKSLLNWLHKKDKI